MPSREPEAVPSLRTLAPRETQLIDRTEEMKVLKEAVDRAVRGEGGIVFLYGEAGIGKTRLTRELGAYARLRGMQVLYGRCPALFRMDGVPPYVLWSEVIRDYLQASTLEQLFKVIGYYPGELAKLVPELDKKLGAIPRSLPINPEHGRDRLFEAVSQFVTNISRDAPLLIILDDLQWADQTSLLLLHYLARSVNREPLLLLGAYRDTDIDEKHPLTPVLTELNRERLLQSSQLKRMGFDDTSEMIKRILEQDDIPREFCELIYEKTRGNPFFAEEVIKSLKEEGVIHREENEWRIKDVSKIEFPKTVKSVIKARIGRLDDECQNVLTLASFIGNDFTVEALCAVTGMEENKLLELMDKMFKTGLIGERVIRGEGICSFADVLVRDVVYEEVSPLKRRKLHEVVGRALEQIYADKINEHLGELAPHFLESGNKDKALDYYLKAGERAATIYANDEAASCLQSALKLIEEKDGTARERARVLERLGDIKRLAGKYQDCLNHWNDALLLLEHLHENESVPRLHRKMAHVLWENIGDAEKAEGHQDKALRILETEPESVESARLYGDMAHMYWRMGDTDKARPWAEKALEFAKKLNDYEIIATSCLSLGTAFRMIGDDKKAIEFNETALEIALNNDYMETAIRAYNNLAVALPPEEIEKSMEYYEKGYELAKKTGDISHISWLGTNLASMYVGQGDMNKAVPLSEESVVLDRKTGSLPHLSMSLAELGTEYRILGEWDKSEKYLREALHVAQGLRDYQAVAMSYGSLAVFYYDKSEYAKARELGEKGFETVVKTGDKMMQWWYSYYINEIRIELGEIEEAQSRNENLYKSALEAKTSDKRPIAYITRQRAKILRTQKKWEESMRCFEESLQEAESLNPKRWWIYDFSKDFLFEYARLYLERNNEGDREKARDLLNQALEIFQKVGAKKDIERTEARMIQIEGRHVAPEPRPVSHVATGHEDLDKLLCGGIPPGYAVVLTSPSCDERDSLVRSFLEAGAKKGEVTFYVTINPGVATDLAEEFQSSFYLFICNPQADAIARDSPNVIKLKGVENLTDIGIALTSTIRKLDPLPKAPRRACIGLVSDVLLQHHAVQARRWLTGLISELRSNGFTTLAIMDPDMHPSQEVRAVLDVFDGQIDIYEKETEKRLQKFLKIRKMSNQKYLENEMPLEKEERN